MNNPQLSELLTEYTRALAYTDIKGPVPDIPTLIS